MISKIKRVLDNLKKLKKWNISEDFEKTFTREFDIKFITKGMEKISNEL